jgi:hypothetical protein
VNIVVVDGVELAPNVDFPPLEAEKYGWLQYPRLGYGEIAPTCASADHRLDPGAGFTTGSGGNIRNGIR